MSAVAACGSLPSVIPSYISSVPPGRLEQLSNESPISFNQVLRQARETVEMAKCATAESTTANGPLRIHVIFGNESCDMDSMVSAIVFAWYLTCLYPIATRNVFIPMMNVARSGLRLRGEATFSFQQAGLDTSLLLFRDELDFTALKSLGEVCVILVDHNQLENEQSHLSENVVAIVDHHKDEQLYLPRTAANRIVEVQGSTTSIIGSLIINNAPVLLSEAYFDETIDYVSHRPPTPLGVVSLLYHVLLLDTSNMSPVTLKYRERDLFVFEQYGKLLQSLTFAELRRRRSDISLLTIRELLEKDTKYGENRRYPHFIASIPCGLYEMVAKDPTMLGVIEEYSRAANLRFVVLLTHHSKGEFKRQITIIVNKDGPNGPPVGTLDAQHLFGELKSSLEEAKLLLDVEPDETLLPPNVRSVTNGLLVQTYNQRNLSGSRKQVAPLVEGRLSKL